MRIAVGITGGSGAIYGLALLKALAALGHESHLVVSEMGAKVMLHECGVGLEDLRGYAHKAYENGDLAASLASGSYPIDGMAIVPCSMKTLSLIASGASNSLLARAADVAIKERRTLVVVPREMPFSPIHLENMLKLSRLGVIALPPCPAFYHHPQDLSDLVMFVVGKILDQLRIEHNLYQRWQGEKI
ncbi:MAG: UbiX family flavin prenyltransferase [Deltaproteobacteria bacterium]|jgi:4-hydroxy-3-polyprenylbenzoate decarboxylase|nr:UbiX family flavin prenyltransferase [Deltaproteobacteria bacterium]